jgi:signal recognition particle receptor subunit alpha
MKYFVFVVLSISGNNVLEKSDLQPALKALKDRLMTKNVVCAYLEFVY